MITIIINNQQVMFKEETFSIHDNLEERSVCSFVVVDKGNNFNFKKGQQVKVLLDNRDIIFNGYINLPRKVVKKGSSGDVAFHTITVADSHYKADKRIVNKAVTDTRAGDIIKEIYEEKLKPEGITIGEDFYRTDEVNYKMQALTWLDVGLLPGVRWEDIL